MSYSVFMISSNEFANLKKNSWTPDIPVVNSSLKYFSSFAAANFTAAKDEKYFSFEFFCFQTSKYVKLNYRK